MDDQNYRVIILGAGFSRPADYPLGTDLWREIMRRADNSPHFNRDLQSYRNYKTACTGVPPKPDGIDFEDFIRYLDTEHFLELRGSDTWSEDGNQSTVEIKTHIGQILTELTPSPASIPRLYLEFAKRLQPNDCVITFNYDVLLERALEAVGKPYRLFPDRFKSVNEHYAECDDRPETEVILLKLHGSIDWFSRASFDRRRRDRKDAGLLGLPDDPIFSHIAELGVTKLVEGPRFADDPLDPLHRVRNISLLYRKQLLFHATPFLLSPSSLKILYSHHLKEFWRFIGNGGGRNFGMAIIGYSLPNQDEYTQQLLYRLVTNYQRFHWNETVFGLRKTPLVIVNRLPSVDQRVEFEQRFRFVDWNRAKLIDSGFGEDSLDHVFASAS